MFSQLATETSTVKVGALPKIYKLSERKLEEQNKASPDERSWLSYAVEQTTAEYKDVLRATTTAAAAAAFVFAVVLHLHVERHCAVFLSSQRNEVQLSRRRARVEPSTCTRCAYDRVRRRRVSQW